MMKIMECDGKTMKVMQNDEKKKGGNSDETDAAN